MQELTSMEEILKIKIIIVGPVSVGKSSIVRGFAKGQFAGQVRGNGQQSNTIAVDFMKKVLKIDNKTVRVDLYDTAGTEIYKSIRSMYYQGAMGALLVYDVTQSDSFYDIKNFLDQLVDACSQSVKIVLLGNKTDLASRQIQRKQGQLFAKANNILFYEVSAQTGKGIEQMFINLIRQILKVEEFKKDFRKTRQLSVKVSKLQDQHKSKCC